ncbi:hypothetical protein D3C81_1867790 [compost metagenome]
MELNLDAGQRSANHYQVRGHGVKVARFVGLKGINPIKHDVKRQKDTLRQSSIGGDPHSLGQK